MKNLILPQPIAPDGLVTYSSNGEASSMNTCKTTACFQNINRAGEVHRYRFAVLHVVIFFAGLGYILSTDYFWLRFLLIVPLSLAAIYFFQARERTCVILAATGEFESDNGTQKQRDAAHEMAAIRSAQHVWGKSFMAVLLVGSAVLSIPW